MRNDGLGCGYSENSSEMKDNKEVNEVLQFSKQHNYTTFCTKPFLQLIQTQSLI